MDYQQLTSFSESKVRSLFGLSRAQLSELLTAVLPVLYRRRQQELAAKPNRKRAPGAGRKRCLTPTQEVLLTLVYLRHNVSHAVCGQLFCVSADKSEDAFHEVVQVLRHVCPSDRWKAEKHWLKSEPTWKPDDIDHILVDSFETSVPRPSLPEKQKRLYSGKKKSHTLKTQVVTNKTGEILSIDPGHRGPTADKTLYLKSDAAKQFNQATKQADLAYKGVSYMVVSYMVVPHKKPDKRSKVSELTAEQKEENRQLASVRVHAEHGIRRIKGWKIVRSDYRLATGLFACVAHAVVGLVQMSRICA